jgi:hypothetical protein
MSSSPRDIIELNIRYFRELLETEQDLATRDMIKRLLAEQEQMLAAWIKKKNG